jgi:hypothetical protein
VPPWARSGCATESTRPLGCPRGHPNPNPNPEPYASHCGLAAAFPSWAIAMGTLSRAAFRATGLSLYHVVDSGNGRRLVGALVDSSKLFPKVKSHAKVVVQGRKVARIVVYFHLRQ